MVNSYSIFTPSNKQVDLVVYLRSIESIVVWCAKRVIKCIRKKRLVCKPINCYKILSNKAI